MTMAKVKLGDVAIEKRETWTGSTQGVPIVGLEHLVPGEVTLSSWDSDTDNTFSKMFRKDQVLLGRRRVYLKKAVIAPFEGICSGDITVIEAIPGKISSRLLPFVIQNDRFFDYAMQGSAGSLSPRVKWEHLKDYEFTLPDYGEQDSLADKLWSALKLKESYHKLLFATDEMVKSRFIEMFGPETAHQRKYPVKKVGDLAECYAGATPSTTVSEYWDNGTISWMSSGEVHLVHVDRTEAKITQKGYDHSSTKMVPIHSVVIALAGQGKTRGTVAITEIPLCTNQSLCAIVPGEELHYEYLFHNLNGRYLELRGMAGDVNGRGGLNLRIIQNIPIVVPPMDDQLAFVMVARQADKSKFELKKAIEKIDKVMRALMQ